MHSKFIRASAFAAVLTAGSILTAVGCSSSGNGVTGSTSSGFCSDYANYVKTCAITDPCTVAISNECATYISPFSEAYVTATTSCVGSAQCGDAGDSATQACVDAKTAAITPSTVQQKFATDVCTACATTLGSASVADCTSSFFSATSSIGLGQAILPYNDTTVTSFDTQCAGDLGADAGAACSTTFFTCLETVLTAASHLPAACSNTSGADAG